MITIENNLQSGFLDLVLEGEQKSHKQISDDMKMFLVGALMRVNSCGSENLFEMIATRCMLSNHLKFEQVMLLGDECLVLLGLYYKEKHPSDIRVAHDVGPMAYATCSGRGGGQLYTQASMSFDVMTSILRSIKKPLLRIV